MSRVGIMVGSGALQLGGGFAFAPHSGARQTPFGQASTMPQVARRGEVEVVMLARHGDDHRFAPHEINYRANVHLLAELDVDGVIAINTVGGIASSASNGTLVLPDQLIDYSWGRAHSFAAESDLRHVDFSDPYDVPLRADLLRAAGRADIVLQDGGVYGCTQGPRFETAAEIVRLERDGCTLVGMTGMPEAGLAREIGLPYASVCLVVNPAAGKAQAIDLAEISEIAATGMTRVARLLDVFLQGLET